MFVVFDLDGTVADCEHRIHHIKLPEKGGDGEWPEQNWDAFYAACDGDSPILAIVEVAKSMRATGHRIEFWTGRSDNCRVQTEVWLTRHGLGSIPVRMRPGDSRMADHRLKRGYIDAYGKPDLVFEDRASVVAMWREEGIICAQVAPGDF